MSVVAFDPRVRLSSQDKQEIREVACAKGLLVEFGTADSGHEFAIVRCPRWTTFGVIKESGCWHAYNEDGHGVSLRTSAKELVDLLANF